MSVDITIQEIVQVVDITVTQNLIEITVTRTTGDGGGGIQSVTGTNVDNTDPLNPIVGVPNTTQVLQQSDRVVRYTSTDTNPNDTIQLDDRLKYVIVEAGKSILEFDDSTNEFPNYSSIPFIIAQSNSIEFTVIGSTDVRSNLGVDVETPITSVTLYRGDNCLLKKGDGIWFLQVDRSGSAPTSNKKEYYAILTYDAGNPTLPIIQEDKNEIGVITASFDDVAGQIILTSSGLFTSDMYLDCTQILRVFSEPPETASIFYETDSIIVIQFYNSVWGAFPDWFINSGFPFWVKLEKYI